MTTGRRRQAPAAHAREVLLRHREAIDDALRAEVALLPRDCLPAVRYHLGWCDADGNETCGYGGKRIRPTLTLLACAAVGAPPEAALPGAVALELVHNFSLVHDDIMDGDATRRHRTTVWARWGVAHALVVGDALLAHAQRILLREPMHPAAAAELADATALMIQGQLEDMSLAAGGSSDEQHTETMEAHKTGALFACAGALGAILGNGDATKVGALRTFGLELGLCFQAIDDVLGIWGDPATTGKPVASDLRERKMSLPVAYTLASGRGPGLEAALSGQLDETSCAAAMDALEQAGARAWCGEYARAHLARALEALTEGGLEPEPVADLAEIARYMVERES